MTALKAPHGAPTVLPPLSSIVLYRVQYRNSTLKYGTNNTAFTCTVLYCTLPNTQLELSSQTSRGVKTCDW
jgi:hypothetical protein